MKKIIDNCKILVEKLEKDLNVKIKKEDVAKLRLRGIGSGFKEGNKQEESNEPLHLCVSSKYKETYKKACELTENLINSIYEQYYKHLSMRGKEFKRIKIKRVENNFTRKNSGSSCSSKYNPPGGQTGNFLIKNKHKSDSKKKHYNQSPIVNNNFDTYGFLDGGMANVHPYSHPTSLNHIRGANNSFLHHRKTNFTARKLFTDSSKKSSGKDPYGGSSQPDFN